MGIYRRLGEGTLVLAALVTSVQPYLIDYTDCVLPSSVTQADANKLCANEPSETSTPTTLIIGQKSDIRRLQGFRCDVHKSSFRFLCGMFSHMKILSPPKIDHRYPVNLQFCRELVTTGKFRPAGVNSGYQVTVGEETIIAFSESGEIDPENNNVGCKGERKRVGNKILDGVLEVVEYRVVLQREEFLTEGDVVESTSDHVKLGGCPSSLGGCQTGQGTYIWDKVQDCDLEIVQSFKPTGVLGSYLVDRSKKILINITGQALSPTGCGDINLKKTNYPDLYIIAPDEATHLRMVNPRDFKVNFQMEIREDYLAFVMEEKIRETRQDLETQACMENKRELFKEPHRLPDGRYGWIQGDVIYLIRCQQKSAPIIEDSSCYDHIPIGQGQFVNPITRLRVDNAAKLPCNKKYPLKIRIKEGTWVSLTPDIHPVSPPDQLVPEDAEDLSHEDLSKGGLYTAKEEEDWERLTSFPSYHEALIKSVTVGVCLQTGSCQQGQMESVRRFDLGNLSPESFDIGIWSSFQRWVREKGDMLAALVLLYVSVKTMTTLVILAWSLMREGPAAMLAVIWISCCGPTASYNKVKRRHRRRQREEVPLTTSNTQETANNKSFPYQF